MYIQKPNPRSSGVEPVGKLQIRVSVCLVSLFRGHVDGFYILGTATSIPESRTRMYSSWRLITAAAEGIWFLEARSKGFQVATYKKIGV